MIGSELRKPAPDVRPDGEPAHHPVFVVHDGVHIDRVVGERLADPSRQHVPEGMSGLAADVIVDVFGGERLHGSGRAGLEDRDVPVDDVVGERCVEHVDVGQIASAHPRSTLNTCAGTRMRSSAS